MSRLGAILLAAGASERFGPRNKLLANIDGRPMVRVTADTLLGADCVDKVIVVTGHDASAIEDALKGLTVRFVFNSAWRNGLGGSVASGVAAVSRELDGVAIVPGDMPFLNSAVIDTLGAEFLKRDGAAIVFPATLAGRQRNPVLWPRRYFGLLEGLAGPQGGKGLLGDLAGSWSAVPMSDERVFRDVDTRDGLRAVSKVVVPSERA
ncbi:MULTISPECIES: nucleotidyltransferase family protein [Methyloceanibacter]|uniref:Molybdopterin biosynthesis protein MoeA n=1 Tax=Methyloceanibacter caenitepidi TaxID=1384459 RepID=A0A0A8K0W4_9HYPH|nr:MULTISPECIES: nucleotidyltransferase family protein [Methyloceanibacter]BAQ16618.1 molybdopterin biosynthesis protein MoeA [Methyloceanibacter caenitepidi]